MAICNQLDFGNTRISTCYVQKLSIVIHCYTLLVPIVAPWQQEESLLIGKIHLFFKFTIIIYGFCVLLVVALLDVTYCNSTHSRHYITKQKLLSRWKLSYCCEPIIGPSVGILKVVTWSSGMRVAVGITKMQVQYGACGGQMQKLSSIKLPS